MNIAELFVRVRGDVADVNTKIASLEAKIRSLENSNARLNNSLGETHLKTGRLGNQFANLAGQIAHVHPIVGNLANVLGDFALGAGLTVGVLAGVAAIAVAYDKLTESSRKARKEQDDLITSLEKAIHLKAMGPGGETIDQTSAARERATSIQTQIQTLDSLLLKDAQDADALASNAVIQKKINDLVAERERLLNDVAQGEKIITEKVDAAAPKIAGHVAAITTRFNELRDAAANVNAEILKEGKDWWKGYIDRTTQALTLTEQLNNQIMAARPSLVDVFGEMITTPIPSVDISDSVKIAGDQAKKINDAAAEHSQQIQNAIFSSAQIIASAIGQALNLGGGGRGSGIGSMLGSGLGGSWGATLGWAGGPIGAVVGGIAGSLIGGLFDHKKAVNQLTAATRQLTQAMLLNAPSGFRVANYRYNATEDINGLGRNIRKYQARGGKNPLLVGT